MAGLRDLAREYESRRFPARRQLDVHGDGPRAARDRALRWIQSYAHEEPGQELLVIVERGRRPGRPPTPVRTEVEKLLGELQGGLIAWWQRFGEGSLVVRVSEDPRLRPLPAEEPEEPADEGRTPETAGAALLALHHDIPDELLGLARQAAELRRNREGISVKMMDVLLRRVWIEAQAEAMSRRIGFDDALGRVLARERERMWEDVEEL